MTRFTSMKLQDLTEDKQRLFTAITNDGTPVSYFVRHMGYDAGGKGDGAPKLSLWLGKMKRQGGEMQDIALAVSDEGFVVAGNISAPEEAIKHSINFRKSYGPSLNPVYNWNVRAFNGTQLKGFK